MNFQVLECSLVLTRKTSKFTEKGVLTVTRTNQTSRPHPQRTPRSVPKLAGDDTIVEDLTFENGMLRIVIRQEVPEYRRRLLPIG